jgi:hypothetical protein
MAGYSRRVDLNALPNGAAKIAEDLTILRVHDTLIFYTADEQETFNRRVREELLN